MQEGACLLMRIKGWAPKVGLPTKVTPLPGGRFLGLGILKEEGTVWTFLCPDKGLFGQRSWLSPSDLQSHLLLFEIGTFPQQEDLQIWSSSLRS